MLDTTVRSETPEGVDLHLHPAGPLDRARAWMIDQLLRLGIYALASFVLGLLGQFGWGLALVVVFLVEWFYPVYFELLHGGATPGKMALGLHAIQDNGAPLEWRGALLRNLLRAADFLPLLYGLGLVVMVLTGRFQRLGDLAAGTLVVYATERHEEGVSGVWGTLPPPVPLSLEEQQAVLAFAERGGQLSPQRRAELAAVLAPLLPPGAPEPEAALHQLANWYRGQGLAEAEP
ncbi:MAG: RDD family protein [Thiohalorhabdus sp.]|uniref:RDD family protein n=1 Tax=Thiohalorhabdus sp. TaxID=3094134 RepID=UPI00397EECDF